MKQLVVNEEYINDSNNGLLADYTVFKEQYNQAKDNAKKQAEQEFLNSQEYVEARDEFVKSNDAVIAVDNYFARESDLYEKLIIEQETIEESISLTQLM